MDTVKILQKDGNYRVLGVKSDENYTIIGDFDQKMRILARRRYKNMQESANDYNQTLRIATENGWEIVYLGDRNNG